MGIVKKELVFGGGGLRCHLVKQKMEQKNKRLRIESRSNIIQNPDRGWYNPKTEGGIIQKQRVVCLVLRN